MWWPGRRQFQGGAPPRPPSFLFFSCPENDKIVCPEKVLSKDFVVRRFFERVYFLA